MSRHRPLVVSLAAALVAYVAAAVLTREPPKAADSGADVVRYFAEHGDDIRAALWCSIVAIAMFMIAAALMHERLPRPHRTLFLVGAVVTGSGIMVSLWIPGGLSLHPEQLDPSTARTVLDVSLFFGPILTASTVVMILPIVLLGFDGRLPRWLGVVSAVVLVEQAVETITVFGKDGFTEPGGAMNLQLGASLFLIWFLATGWVLSRLPSTADAA